MEEAWLQAADGTSVWDAVHIVERLHSQLSSRADDLHGEVERFGERVAELEDHLAEVNYGAVEETMQDLPRQLDAMAQPLRELALLTNVRDGESQEKVALNIPATPELRVTSLFVEDDHDDDDDDDDYRSIELVRERVGNVALHIYACLRASHYSLELAVEAPEKGDDSTSRQAHEHAAALAAKGKDGFDLWVEVLEGHLAQSGTYPGAAGEQVASFMDWLRQQPPP